VRDTVLACCVLVSWRAGAVSHQDAAALRCGCAGCRGELRVYLRDTPLERTLRIDDDDY
jgi:hypothetical protein